VQGLTHGTSQPLVENSNLRLRRENILSDAFPWRRGMRYNDICFVAHKQLLINQPPFRERGALSKARSVPSPGRTTKDVLAKAAHVVSQTDTQEFQSELLGGGNPA
jgi:hypothetical protein